MQIKKVKRKKITARNVGRTAVECMCICVVWSFWENSGQERLNCHLRSFYSRPVHSHQHCVLLSGLHSRTVHDEMMTKERVGEWHNCDGMENSLSKELSQRNWSCVWMCSDSSASPHLSEGWRSANVLHCHPAFWVRLVSHSPVTQHFHRFTIGVY